MHEEDVERDWHFVPRVMRDPQLRRFMAEILKLLGINLLRAIDDTQQYM